MESALRLNTSSRSLINLQGLPGVYRIADDLLITGQGDTKEDADKDHDANLVRLFQRCRDKAKFNFKCQQVTFIWASAKQ